MNTTLHFKIVNDFVEFYLFEDEDEEIEYSIDGYHSLVLDIQFNGNEYKICTGNDNCEGLINNIVSEIIQNPQHYTTYTIQFNAKEYELTGECILAIIFNELIQKVMKQKQIDYVEIEISSNDDKHVPLISYLRIKNAFNLIGLNNLNTYCDYEGEELSSEEEDEYDETVTLLHQEMNQEKYYKEISQKIKPNESRILTIQNLLTESLKHLNSLQELYRDNQICEQLNEVIQQLKYMKETNNYSNEEMNTLGRFVRCCDPSHLPLNLKRIFNYTQLDQYTIFLSMMYLNSIDDMINVVETSSKYQHVFDKFYFNPVSVNKQTIEFFPNIQLLRLYNSDDESIYKKQIHTIQKIYKREINNENETVREYFCNQRWKKTKVIKPIKEKDEDSTKFENKSFENNLELKEITIPSDITELKDNHFSNCINLSNIILPKNLKRIGHNVFENCTNLKEVSLPSSVTSIEEDCFKGCDGIKIITSPHMKQLNNYIQTHWNKMIYQRQIIWNENEFTTSFQLKSIYDVDIPEGIITFNKSYFFSPSHIYYLNLPPSLMHIESYTLNECISIQSLIIPDSVTSIGEECINNMKYLRYISLSTNLKTIRKGNFKCLENIQSIQIPESVTIIEDDCFNECNNLESIQLSSNLLKIGNNCLNKLHCIEEIIIPESVESIGENCLSNCYFLTHIKLSSQLKKIQKGNFNYLNQLESIELPLNITMIENECFNYLNLLKELIIPENVISIGEKCFGNCSSLSFIYLSPLLQTIGNWNFYKCDSLEEIIIPENVIIIGMNCFNECLKLSSIEFLNENIFIDEHCFENCLLLKRDGIIHYFDDYNQLDYLNYNDFDIRVGYN